MKRSQMEILGLVVVILLVLLGLLLYVKFVVLQPTGKPIKEDFTKSQMAQNYINTLLDTTTSCNNMQVSKLAGECENIKMGLSSNVKCMSNLNPCGEIKHIANETLDKVMGMYAFRFSMGIDNGNENEWINVTSVKFDSYGSTVGSGKAVLPSKLIGQSLYFKLDVNI